jgi:hypothetical protein
MITHICQIYPKVPAFVKNPITQSKAIEKSSLYINQNFSTGEGEREWV